MSLNQMTIIGNVGKEPEMRFTPSGKPVTSFSVAVNRKYTVDGEKREETEWVSVVAWAKLAELCNQYLNKGRQVYVQGRMSTHSWEDATGQKRYKTELIAKDVLFLGERKQSEEVDDIDPEDILF